jgi:hypothetical protein
MSRTKKTGALAALTLAFVAAFAGCPMEGDSTPPPPEYKNWLQIADTGFTGYFGVTKLYGAAYGNDRYVVVGQDGKAAWSADGLYWQGSVAGTDIVYYSSGCNSLAFVNGKFYTFGSKIIDNESRPSIVFSSNGDEWTEVSQSVFIASGSYIVDIAYGEGVYVMVCDGFSGGSDYRNPKIAWSTNLEEWTVVENLVPALNAPLYQIEYGGGTFVAVGGTNTGGVTAWSEDGKTWNVGSFNQGTQSRSLVYGNGRFVSVGRAHNDLKNAKYSTDGKQWTTYNLDWSQYINALAFGGGVFLTGGNNQAKIATDPSADANWKPVTQLQDIFMSGVWINGAGWGNNRFIAVGDQGTAAISTN